jgi:hypothetical protein
LNNDIRREDLRGNVDFAATAERGVTKMRWTTAWTICAQGTVGGIAGGYPDYQNGQ